MMQWVPYGAPEVEFKEHIRTFAAVFPHVTIIRGAGGYGVYMLGSETPMTFEPDAIRTVLARPGVLEDMSSAYDSPADTIDDWVAVIDTSAVARRSHGRRATSDRPARHRRPAATGVLPRPPAHSDGATIEPDPMLSSRT